jgi:hypothetical protein
LYRSFSLKIIYRSSKPNDFLTQVLIWLITTNMVPPAKCLANTLPWRLLTDARRADAEYYKAFCSLNLYHSDAEKQIESFIVKNPTHPRAGTANYDLANFYYG